MNVGETSEQTPAKGTTASELRIPSSLYGTLYPLICHGIVLLTVSVALFNFLHFRTTPVFSLLASGLWLLIVALVIAVGIEERVGVYSFLLHQAGAYSRKHLVEVVRSSANPSLVCFGYQFFGRRFHYLRIHSDAISSVSWTLGQGGGENGCFVSIDFDRYLPLPGQPSGRRLKRVFLLVADLLSGQKAEKLFQALAEFLRGAGAQLVPKDVWEEGRDQEGLARCSKCRQPLRTAKAQQCFECGHDWHGAKA